MAKTEPLSIRISPELKKGLEKLAEIEKRSISSLVIIMIEDYLEKTPITKQRK